MNCRSLAELLDSLEAEHGRFERVVLTGERPGDSNRVLRGWLGRLGHWVQIGTPYIGPSTIRLRVGRDGREVAVTWSAAWFGAVSDPDAVAAATMTLRHVCGRAGARMVGTPATTGLAMLRHYWTDRDWDFPTIDPEIQSAIRSTSGQGRFELFERGRRRGGNSLLSIDARFQYAAIARTLELGVGEPLRLGPNEPAPYAAAWVNVDVIIDADQAPPFGLLGVASDGAGWHYPARGRFRTWAHWCEVELARQHGYTCEVVDGWVWPKRARALAGWASNLIRERDRADSPAVRAGCRNLAIQTIGALHGRDVRREYVVGDTAEIPADADGWAPTDDGRWRYTVREASNRNAYAHPEWTSHIWAVARGRLARQMLRTNPEHLVACALDSIYVTKAPPLAVDEGKAGAWRQTGHVGRWQAFGSMTDVYRRMAAG